MFERVLIAEDHSSVNEWVWQLLARRGSDHIKRAHFCDDALNLIKIALAEDRPVDLLVTDLSFRAREGQRLKDGAELINAARNLQPGLKVLVFSAEEQPSVVRTLVERFAIDGYVLKGSRDEEDMTAALDAVVHGKLFVSQELRQAVRAKNAHDFSDYDIVIIKELVKGTYQRNIPYVLEQAGFKNFKLRTVEKRLGQIRDALGFTKNEQLIAYCKDHWII